MNARWRCCGSECSEAHDGGYGSVIVYNVDGESGKLLAGAAYALYKSNDEYVGTYTVGAYWQMIRKY